MTIAGVNITLVVIARGNDDCFNELLNHQIDNVSKAQDIIDVRISDDVVLDGKLA